MANPEVGGRGKNIQITSVVYIFMDVPQIYKYRMSPFFLLKITDGGTKS
jgi:hypothetical protein